MARRFGGSYSPQPASETNPAAAQPPAASTPRGTSILFVPGMVLAWQGLGDGALKLALALVAAGVLTLGAWLTREGLRAEAAWRARRSARRPAFPRKSAGSVLIGLGVAMAAVTNLTHAGQLPGGSQLAGPALYGLIAAALHVAGYGLDPMRDKGMEGIDAYQQDRVARAVEEGEAYLAAMTEAAARTGDRELTDRVARFEAAARTLFRTVEEDPRDLTAARRYLTVYLRGARDATIRYADIASRTPDAQARADYLALLDDLEQNFAARSRKMLLDDRADLSVEIDVLRDRLKREGVATE